MIKELTVGGMARKMAMIQIMAKNRKIFNEVFEFDTTEDFEDVAKQRTKNLNGKLIDVEITY